MRNRYDAIVIGAGPAALGCSRRPARMTDAAGPPMAAPAAAPTTTPTFMALATPASAVAPSFPAAIE